MNKLIAASSLALLALLAACSNGGQGLARASDGSYLSTPASPAAKATGAVAAAE